MESPADNLGAICPDVPPDPIRRRVIHAEAVLGLHAAACNAIPLLTVHVERRLVLDSGGEIVALDHEGVPMFDKYGRALGVAAVVADVRGQFPSFFTRSQP